MGVGVRGWSGGENTRKRWQPSVTIFIFFTRFFKNVHPPPIINAVATLRRDLIAAGQIERIPGEEPVIPIRHV